MLFANAEPARRRATGRPGARAATGTSPGVQQTPDVCWLQPSVVDRGAGGDMQHCAIPVGIGHLVLIPGRQVATDPGNHICRALSPLRVLVWRDTLVETSSSIGHLILRPAARSPSSWAWPMRKPAR